MNMTCWKCSQTLAPLEYGRNEHCNKCGFDTRVCKNCIHYDPASHNECREPQADRVVDKEKSNFCDYFKPGDGGKGASHPSQKDLKSAADALFKKK